MRAFLAIELDHQLRAYAAGAVSDVRRHVDALAPDAVCSWVRPEQLHLTVRFLGELSDTAVGAVARMTGIAATGYRVISNCGRDGHQEVPHLHVHVLGGRPMGRMVAKAE